VLVRPVVVLSVAPVEVLESSRTVVPVAAAELLVTFTRERVPVSAELEEIAAAVPVVSAFATTRTIPVDVVAPEAVTASRSPVVVMTPEEVMVTP
jgi:hypothetical protein